MIWHNWNYLSVPREIATPWPTLSPTQIRLVPSQTPEPTQTPLPDFHSEAYQASDSLIDTDPYSETDELTAMGIAILPVIFVVSGVLILRWLKQNNSW